MKRPYQPPQARNLYAGFAMGQVTEGACKSGERPYYDCIAGTSLVWPCSPGAAVDTSYCSVGGYHLQPQCDAGASAATICLSGGGQGGGGLGG